LRTEEADLGGCLLRHSGMSPEMGQADKYVLIEIAIIFSQISPAKNAKHQSISGCGICL
jgi:hypothetical protein